jgi:phosphoglycolate phosphatase
MNKIYFKGVEAVLFDFEGTLVDHQWNRKEAVQETLKRLSALGFPVNRLHGKRYSLLKNEATAIALEIGQSPDEVKKEIDEIYERFDEDALLRWNLRSEAKAFLSLLKTYGIQTGMVTNLGSKTLNEGIKRLGLHNLFDIVVSRNDVHHLKPNGEGIRLAIDHLGVSGEKAFYVGDSLDDIQAAKDAGLRVIIILGGENSRSEILSGGPDFLIRDYGELIACLKEDLN